MDQLETRVAQREQFESRLAKAMAHPLRNAALIILSERTASAKEISEEIGEDVSRVSYHVRKLVELHCIEKVGDRRVRGAVETFYRAVDLPIVFTDEWEKIPPERRPTLIGGFIQSILDYAVASIKARKLGEDGKFWIGPIPLIIDEKGLDKLLALHEELTRNVSEIQSEYAEREEAGEAGEPIHVVSAHATFPIPPPQK